MHIALLIQQRLPINPIADLRQVTKVVLDSGQAFPELHGNPCALIRCQLAFSVLQRAETQHNCRFTYAKQLVPQERSRRVALDFGVTIRSHRHWFQGLDFFDVQAGNLGQGLLGQGPRRVHVVVSPHTRNLCKQSAYRIEATQRAARAAQVDARAAVRKLQDMHTGCELCCQRLGHGLADPKPSCGPTSHSSTADAHHLRESQDRQDYVVDYPKNQ